MFSGVALALSVAEFFVSFIEGAARRQDWRPPLSEMKMAKGYWLETSAAWTAGALAFLIVFVWVIKAIIFPNGLDAPGLLDPKYGEATYARAHSPTKLEVCNITADMARTVALRRDRGVTEAEQLREAEAMAPAIRAALTDFILGAYLAPAVTADQGSRWAFEGCMETPTKNLR